WEKWFAPCVEISSCGIVLVQHKTKPLTKLPTYVPSFFNDLKTNNWGELNGRPVCHDYGIMPMFRIKSAKMVKAKWRKEE
ncbi:MAG: hypothetical protein KAJ19_02895, partial [Gammaproteobacteria bacterium]|nr:hypothetical protein [Gammaproteobacteria bacterium]